MNRWLGAAVAVVVAVCSGWLGPAAAVAAADPTIVLEDPMVRRSGDAFSIEACLEGAARIGTPPGPSATSITSSVVLSVDGVALPARTEAVRYSLPSMESHCASGVRLGTNLTLADLAQLGVVPGPAGTWTDFELDVRVDIQGHQLGWTQQIDLGAGPPIGDFTAATASAEGVRVTGWVVDPTREASERIVVTVDGRDVLFDATPEPMRSGADYVMYANQPDADSTWADRELGNHHAFDELVPFGKICVHVVKDQVRQLIGCRTVNQGAFTASIRSITIAPTADRLFQTVTVSGIVTNPWWSIGEQDPEMTLSASPRQRYWDTSLLDLVPTRSVPGPLPDGTGAFTFTSVQTGVSEGRVQICLHDFQNRAPDWPVEWRVHGTGAAVSCRSVWVPFPWPVAPQGNVEAVTADGRSVTVKGWTLDRNGGSPRVLVAIDGFPVAVTRPNRPRPDVAAALGGEGTAGFAVSTSASTGSHEVCTLWEDTQGGGWSTPVCSSVVVK